jgi:acetyl/propionyl-CoA carboxylase alpha subunit
MTKPVRIDGKPYDLATALAEHRWSSGGRLTLTVDGRTIDAIVVRAGGGAGRWEVWLEDERHLVEEPRRTAGTGGAGEEDALTAPMPAKIVRVHVAAGDAVSDGQALVILESMKMELTVSAPRAGKVRRVGCAPGEIVAAGATLVELEPETAG